MGHYHSEMGYDPSPEPRSPDVQTPLLDRNERTLKMLVTIDRSIDGLRDKLEPVLLPSVPTPPNDGGGLKSDPDRTTPLAEQQLRVMSELSRVIGRLDDLLNRIEL